MRAEDDLTAIDRLIGYNIRFHRLRNQLSQAKLAARIGIRYQQLQKYERGANRISASRLWRISEVLGVAIGAFFEGSRRADAVSNSAAAHRS